MSIGANIRRLREKQGLTQAELASRLYITQSMLCQIERETKNPSLQVCKSLADILGCRMETLLAEQPEPGA